MAKKANQAPASLFDQFETVSKPLKSPKKVSPKKKTKEDLDKDRRKRAKNKEGFSTAGDLLSRFQVSEKNKHISHEFQSYGCHLANVLNDKKHTGLYIKLAKTTSRGVLERALSFVIDSTADNKAKLFMWKLGKIKEEQKDKKE